MIFSSEQIKLVSLPDDLKTAIILSKINLKDKPFFIFENNSSEIKFKGSVTDSPSVYGSFNFCYEIDFSNLKYQQANTK